MPNPYVQTPSSLLSLALYFLKLGSLGFGGPIALTAAMREDLVEKRKWFTEEAFEQGMTLSQLAPGPLAAQMAIYFGWAHSGTAGATLIGLIFVLPSFLIVLVLALLYMEYGRLDWLLKVFYGVGAAVIAVIALGAWKLCKKTLKKDRVLWTFALLNTAVTAITGAEILWVFLLSGLAVMAVKTNLSALQRLPMIFPLWMVTGMSGPAAPDTLWSLFIFFMKAGSFVFGSGLAIVPFLHGGVVEQYQWLNEKQFLDAVAVAMITPGPVVITVAFIGFLVAGFSGACIAAAGTFIPCYLFTVIPAPHFSKWAKNRYVHAFVTGVTTAAVGAIGGAVIVLGRNALVDTTAALLCLAAFAAILKFRIPEPLVILSAGMLGWVAKG